MENRLYKVEAAKRMTAHGLSAEVVHNYLFGEIMCSENGKLRKCTEKEIDMIKEYEKESGCFVYHLIHAFANIGETYEFLRVSNYIEDWDVENQELEQGIILVHSVNVTHPNWSESGWIQIRKVEGLLRIA